MSLTTQVKLTLCEKLDILPAVASIIVAAFYALLTGFWRTERQAKSLLLHFGYAIMRKSTQRLTATQMQFILPGSTKIYDRFAKKAGYEPHTVELSHGATGHWIGDPNATNVLIWYHGGGFCLPSNRGYINFYAQLVRHLEATGKSLAVFALTYTLAPTATYPTQLKQAVSCARYILAQPNRDPATVFLGGDSAGGNLACGVLSHLAHPHPQIEALPLDSKLGGAIMIAPWTLLDAEFPDQDIYSGGDLLTPHVAGPWATAVLGRAPRDNYTDLFHAPADWFSTFPVKSVLITGGGNEIMLPIILEFSKKFKAGFGDVEMFVGHRECHVAPVYNFMLHDNSETEQGKKIKSWLVELAH
ncbi:hypothetical protein N7466_008310 [Penicillium verhagenii]|uniref:uncharacterized protein n=1 Tax=Penicillium verhagenii TaxID=1562060 RepID=UPI002545259F|nr:uncharacterized protein N7466_008310 [Penicillium verhagenii]KAJ5924123.1 hypothetical protein N7466_008310 [Penicillium verhagenii]